MDNQNSQSNPLPETPPAQTPPVQSVSSATPPSPHKPFLSGKIIILIVILLIVLAGGGAYLTLNSKPKPAPTVSQVTPTTAPTTDNSGTQLNTADDYLKNDVNLGVSVLKVYFAQNGSYPKDFTSLKGDYNNYIDPYLFDIISKPPFKYKSDGVTYEFSVTLSTGEAFRGEKVAISKILDQDVKNDLHHLVSVIGVYDSLKGKLPTSLDELKGVAIKTILKNPVTGGPYNYYQDQNGNFTVSGVLSDGSTYQDHGSKIWRIPSP